MSKENIRVWAVRVNSEFVELKRTDGTATIVRSTLKRVAKVKEYDSWQEKTTIKLKPVVYTQTSIIGGKTLTVMRWNLISKLGLKAADFAKSDAVRLAPSYAILARSRTWRVENL